MITIGFLLNFPLEYKGGVNYLKNLFFAIKASEKDQVAIKLFVPTDLPETYWEAFEKYGEIIPTRTLKRGAIPWAISRVFEKKIHFDPLTAYMLRKHKVDIVSHSNYVYPFRQIKSINWIPDFQYLHYSNLWSRAQLAGTKKLNDYLVQKSNQLVLSSYDTFKDYKSAYPDYTDKVKVIHFVSQPHKELSKLDAGYSKSVALKYLGEDVPFFYLPNQFWTHKNHITVFKACRILAHKGLKFQLLTSGYMKDFRSSDNHMQGLFDYVSNNGLQDIIKFLGLISYDDVFELIYSACALINPSYFEGWSSTVEEAKTMGTLTILSDISIHREQNPLDALYFNPDSPEELAVLMEDVLENKYNYQRPALASLKSKLEQRTLDFGSSFAQLAKQASFSTR